MWLVLGHLAACGGVLGSLRTRFGSRAVVFWFKARGHKENPDGHREFVPLWLASLTLPLTPRPRRRGALVACLLSCISHNRVCDSGAVKLGRQSLKGFAGARECWELTLTRLQENITTLILMGIKKCIPQLFCQVSQGVDSVLCSLNRRRTSVWMFGSLRPASPTNGRADVTCDDTLQKSPSSLCYFKAGRKLTCCGNLKRQAS